MVDDVNFEDSSDFENRLRRLSSEGRASVFGKLESLVPWDRAQAWRSEDQHRKLAFENKLAHAIADADEAARPGILERFSAHSDYYNSPSYYANCFMGHFEVLVMSNVVRTDLIEIRNSGLHLADLDETSVLRDVDKVFIVNVMQNGFEWMLECDGFDWFCGNSLRWWLPSRDDLLVVAGDFSWFMAINHSGLLGVSTIQDM